MSTRVDLALAESPHPHLVAAGVPGRVIRLVASTFLRQDGTWSQPHTGIVDTGAPLSLIPQRIWKSLPSRILASGQSVAIMGQTVAADLGEVTALVMDAANASPQFSMSAYLCHSDRVPLLLGFEDFLTRVTLVCAYPSRTAYVEFP